MSQDRPAPILDVRSERSFQRRHLRGAVHLNESRLLAEPYLLPPRHRRFLVVGRDEAHASEVASRLRDAGWTSAEPARGGSLDNEIEVVGPSRGHLWEPAPFLEEVASRLPARGRALDLACGSGRNTVYLALAECDRRSITAGMEEGASSPRVILGVDILPDALEQARRVRRASGCPAGAVRFQRADLTDETTVRSLLRPLRYAIVICFRYLDRALLPRIATTLAPGGMLVYETFLAHQRDVHGKPSNPAFLLEPGELRRSFSDLEVLHYREGEDETGNFTASLLASRRHSKDPKAGFD